MNTRLYADGIQCRQFDPVTGPFSMNNDERKDGQSIYSIGSQKNLIPVKSRQTCFKKRTQISSLLMIILYFLVGVLLVTVLVLAMMYVCKSTKKICDSEDCVRIAASLKESMDVSVDPCDDFYQYACGRWSQEHPIPDSSWTTSWFSERGDRISRKTRDLLNVNMSKHNVPWAVTQAKALFTSCMDVQAMNNLGLSPLFDLLALLNLPSVPVLTNKTGNYIEQAARAKRILGRDIFFSLEIAPDPRNNSKNVIILDAPYSDNTFPSNKELEKRLQDIRGHLRRLEDIDEESMLSENEEIELNFMTDVIMQIINNDTETACVSENESNLSKEELKEFVEMLYDMSITVYYMTRANQNQSMSEEDISDNNYISVDELQRITDEYVKESNSTLKPKTIWRPFMESVFGGTVLYLDDRDKILIGNLNYFMNLALVLAAAEEKDLESYIWWVIVDSAVPYSSEKLRNIWTSYVNKLMKKEISKSKSISCAAAVNELMGMAVSWLLVDPTFHSNKIRNVLEMLEDIRQAFASLITETDWMDQKTKIVTFEKNRKMSSQIGFPRWLFNETTLNQYYKGIDLSETRFLENMVQIIQLESESTLACLRDYRWDNESFWATDPIDVNAFHAFQLNQITIPIGILQFPFYELGLEALNYGAIGAILGHELTHGFDNSGRHYDSDGNLRQWWTNKTIFEYTERTQCFIDHYNTYYISEVDDYINGELTLGENIADNGGLREAVVAYKRWKARHGQELLLPGFTQLTHEQLLFLSFAHLWCETYSTHSSKLLLEDSHCPGRVRLQAVLRNSKEFSDAWNCPVGSYMNPSKKCHLW